MVWIPSEDSPYHVYVTKLAYVNPVVGLAMAAVSSSHALNPVKDDTFPEKARNEAVGMISAYVKDVITHVTSGHDIVKKLDQKSAEEVLAGMLILSCYEMTSYGASASNFHRRAARSLVNTLGTIQSEDRVLLNFLRNQLSIHDIFAATTSFDLSTMIDVILPYNPDNTVLFSSWLACVHDVTLLSRQLQPSPARWSQMGLTFNHIQTQFEFARGETLMAAGRFALQPASRRRDFICVVNMLHYAALLYSSRCLEIECTQKGFLIDCLFDQIVAMNCMDDWIHCLAWAFFMCGVEIHGEKDRQIIVSDLYRMICNKLRFQNFKDAFRFLEEFWAGSDRDWRNLARDWESAGQPILLP